MKKVLYTCIMELKFILFTDTLDLIFINGYQKYFNETIKKKKSMTWLEMKWAVSYICGVHLSLK